MAPTREGVSTRSHANATSTPVTTMRDIPNPFLKHPRESQGLEAVDKTKWQDQAKMVYGPQCWKCHGWGIWWKCQDCDRSYHKRCAFFGKAFPHPVFNMPLVEAVDAEKDNKSIMVKCTQCIINEETTVQMLKDVPIETLNKIFAHIASWMETMYGGVMSEINDVSVFASPTLIKNTVLEIPGAYKTIEGFCADYKLIKFQTFRRYGESQQYDAVCAMLKIFDDDIRAVTICWECYLRRFNPDPQCVGGNELPSKEMFPMIEVPCTVPHPIVWVNLPDCYSGMYWPAKLLSVDKKTGEICFQCFRERAIRFAGLEGTTKFWTYSEKNLNRRNRRKDKKSKSLRPLKDAMSSCRKYRINLQERFGSTAIIVQKEAVELTGVFQYKDVFNGMFPKLDISD